MMLGNSIPIKKFIFLVSLFAVFFLAAFKPNAVNAQYCGDGNGRNCGPDLCCLISNCTPGEDPTDPTGWLCDGNCGECPSGGGSICRGCWPNFPNSMGRVVATYITNQVPNPASFTVNWEYEEHGCKRDGNFVVYIGTDRDLVNSNCQEYPAGCTAIKQVPLTTRSLNTRTAGITLSSTKTYFVKVVTEVTYKIGVDEYETEICPAANPVSFLGSCSVTPSTTGPLSIGDTRLFTTNIDIAGSTNIYLPVPLRIYRRGQLVRECDDDGKHCRNVYHNSEMHIVGYKLGTSGSDWVTINSSGLYFRKLIPIKWYDGEGYVLDIKYGADLYPVGFNEASANAITVSQISLAYNGNGPPPYLNIDNVKYSKAPGTNYFDIVTQSPNRNNPDTNSPYEALIRATFQGNTFLRSDVYAKGVATVPACTAYSPITIVEPVAKDPWWQVKNSDVQSDGGLKSLVPSGKYFGDVGSGGYPGVPAYGFTAVFGNGSVSQKGWIAQSTSTGGRIFDYQYFDGQIPDDTRDKIKPISAQTDLTGAEPVNGYEWYKYTGPVELTLNSAITLNATRKVILFVDNANLKITKNINLNGGFLLIIVNGKITIDPTVTRLEGLFVADGDVSTGTKGAELDSQLYVLGSMASYGKVNFNRDLTDNAVAAEVFEYDPRQILLFPSTLGLRKMGWKEVAP